MRPAMTRPVDLPVATEKQLVREERMMSEGESMFAEVLSDRVSREGLRQTGAKAEGESRLAETEDAPDGLALMLAETAPQDDKKTLRVKSPVLGMVADHELTLKSDKRLAGGLLTQLGSQAQRASTAQGLRKMVESQAELAASQTARQKAGELAQSQPLKEAVKLLERATGHLVARETAPRSESRTERIVEREQAARGRVKETPEATTKRPSSVRSGRPTTAATDRVRVANVANQRSETATHIRERARAIAAKAALRTTPLQRIVQGAAPQAQQAVAAAVATRLVQPTEAAKPQLRPEARPAAKAEAPRELTPVQGAQVTAAAQGGTDVAPTQQVAPEAPVAAVKTAQDVMQMTDQLIDQLDGMISKRVDVSHKLTVQLGKELGEVKLAVVMNAGGGKSLHVTLEAAEAQTATLLKSSISAITDGLKDKGYLDPVIEVEAGRDAEAATDHDADGSRGQDQKELSEQAEAYLAAIGRRAADRGGDK